MASKFQNRLVGTVILVALVVIFLPDLMDGNKLEQKDEAFANIPLRPELEPAKPALQVSAASTLPADHVASQQQAAAAEQWQVEEIGGAVTLAANQPSAAQAQQPVTQPVAQPQPKPEVVAKKPVEQPKPKPVPPKPVEVKKPVETKPQVGQIKSMDDLIASKMTTPATPAPAAAAPAQGSWILQLGAFKNADSVNALVSKLRAAGYSAQTSPRTPVQGQITRVFVGPDVSKAKLQGMQSKISQMTGLGGSVVAYNP
ncbi:MULTISPECIES: cell division protein DedD [Aeromonas]|uniref:cell division protein DedD n=1 Tax=Aeromonas TaxID=642 RepID=UPI00051BF74C|nr:MULTISPECIES: cell division protein DedD [Aeromonas]MCH7372198.1 cell division protein DedD [Aeromonas sp. MR16]